MNENTNKKLTDVSQFSIVSLAVSIVAIVILKWFSRYLSIAGLVLFLVLTIVALVLPPIAKKNRLKTGKKGKVLEIIAIILGGFCFYTAIFALTGIGLYFGYLGWVICGFFYAFTGKDF